MYNLAGAVRALAPEAYDSHLFALEVRAHALKKNKNRNPPPHVLTYRPGYASWIARRNHHRNDIFFHRASRQEYPKNTRQRRFFVYCYHYKRGPHVWVVQLTCYRIRDAEKESLCFSCTTAPVMGVANFRIQDSSGLCHPLLGDRATHLTVAFARQC